MCSVRTSKRSTRKMGKRYDMHFEEVHCLYVSNNVAACNSTFRALYICIAIMVDFFMYLIAYFIYEARRFCLLFVVCYSHISFLLVFDGVQYFCMYCIQNQQHQRLLNSNRSIRVLINVVECGLKIISMTGTCCFYLNIIYSWFIQNSSQLVIYTKNEWIQDMRHIFFCREHTNPTNSPNPNLFLLNRQYTNSAIRETYIGSLGLRRKFSSLFPSNGLVSNMNSTIFTFPL